MIFLAAASLAGCSDPDPEEEADAFDPVDITLGPEVVIDGKEYKPLLNQALNFRDSKDVLWTAPEGTRTDGASIPDFAIPFIGQRFDREYLKAAVLHDAYCQDINEEFTPGQYQAKPWEEVHDMFYEACVANGTPMVKAMVMWAAVWLGGPRWDEPVTAPNEEERREALAYGMAGSAEWIEKNKPDMATLRKEMIERGKVQVELLRNERAITDALRSSDKSEIERKIKLQQDRLEQELKIRPDDLMLRNFRGHASKHQARLHELNNNPAAVEQAIDAAKADFEQILKRRKMDQKSLNALSEIHLRRTNYREAEKLNERILKYAPRDIRALERQKKLKDLRGPRGEG